MSADTRFDAEYFSRVYPVSRLRPWTMQWWSAYYYARLCRRFMAPGNGRRLLELGSGLGYVPRFLGSGLEYHGVDLAEEEILNQARQGVPGATFHRRDIDHLENDPEFGGLFDMILAKYTFEHLLEPQRAFDCCRGMLRNGGLLLFSVPNLESPGQRLRGEEWYAWRDPTHVNLLWPAEWLDRCQRSGFRIEAVWSDGFWDVPYLPGVPRLIQLGFGMVLGAVQILFTGNFLPHNWGENLIVLARNERSLSKPCEGEFP